MKKHFLFILFSLCIFLSFSQSQTITFIFNGKNAQTQEYVALQSVLIRNLSLGCDTTLYGDAPSLIITSSSGINENNPGNAESFSLMQNTPNPFNGSTNVNINLKKKVKLFLSVSDARGQKIAAYKNEFSAGLHKFEIHSSTDNLLIMNVSDGNTSKSLKLLNLSTNIVSDAIIYKGIDVQHHSNTFKSGEISGFIYELGNQLQFIASADGYYYDTITDTPLENTTYDFQMNPTVSDGFYVKGLATAYSSVNANAKMKITRNEVTQTDRVSLLELYIPIKAGADGFNIVQVIGSAQQTYGPGAGFETVEQGTIDEVQVAFQRGPVQETTSIFTVPADGMYHVIIDYELLIVVIVPVHWGIIGAAAPNGWGSSTPLSESAFNLTAMEWEISDMVFIAAEWKFRYSEGWKVILDAEVNIGGGNYGVKVNTNLGESIDLLIPGGSNIYNGVPGIYTCNISYVLGTGYYATLTKTDDLPLVDYTNTELGLVGNGIIVDGVQNTWDYTIMLHSPTIENETEYYWTYDNVELTTAGSFKIREGQDWTGMSFGYNDVILAGSAADKFGTNFDNNFVPLEDGIYDMVLKIEAATETYTLTVNPAGAASDLDE